MSVVFHGCSGCTFKLHNKTNIADFCDLGYTQIPMSELSTFNVLMNNGKVCNMNPWKRNLMSVFWEGDKDWGKPRGKCLEAR